ncbi:chromosomal replication initiator protein DnaA [Desulfovibrio sp. OttesenSCG-928-C06]|nr:chromosomal replication initiator protein DnaA [Desulfovibrio sp. OttesenSCG-928-C06]
MENIWGKIRQILAEKLPDAQYKVWILPLQGKIENDCLVVTAMNDFVAKFVRNRFSADIASAAAEASGRQLGVNIRALSPSATAEAATESSPAVIHNASHGVGHNDGHEATPTAFGSANALPARYYATQAATNAPAGSDFTATASFGGNSAYGISSSDSQPVKTGPENAMVPAVLPWPALTASVTAQELRQENGTLQQQGSLPMRWPENRGSARLARNWRYSFEDFIVGPCNELAHAAARGICKTERCSFGSSDVLFLCSAPGLGKTHLMQAVGAGLIKASNLQAPRVEYLSAEEFATQMRYALRNGDIDRFKARYRDADVMLLEDIHFLQDKEKTQNEVLATLSALMEKGSRVVLTSSFALPELKKMDSQLFSRLSSGLVASIDRPDTETRRRIISHKAGSAHINLSGDVADYLAENINSDVRQIESCLRNLALKASLLNCAINLEMARETVSNYLGLDRVLTIESIVRLVCEGFGISTDALNSKSRKHECVQARNAAFYLARKHTELSLQEIGKRFNRTHSTVIKGITSLEREMSRETTAGRQLSNAISAIERTSLRA